MLFMSKRRLHGYVILTASNDLYDKIMKVNIREDIIVITFVTHEDEYCFCFFLSHTHTVLQTPVGAKEAAEPPYTLTF